MTNASIETPQIILKQVFYLQYLVKFCKNKETIQALIDFGSEVNIMTPAYTTVLNLKVCPTPIKI